MDSDAFYGPGPRRLQDRFDTRRLADRLVEVSVGDHFTPAYRKMVERAPFFWLATADADGWPEVSYKGGVPGFVRVLDDDRTVAFPSYDGNGMYRSLGNLLDEARVGLLFCDFDRPKRLRVRGVATVRDEPEALASFPGAELVVEVRAEQVFFNCPRYLHRMTVVELSEYAPSEAHTPPAPEWKEREDLRPYLPAPRGPSA
jgi:uncharacterized protein